MPRTLITFLILILSPATFADDWPQWLGPRRDGVWREPNLLTAFPKEGLTIKWRTPVAGGYAGPAVANGRVYLIDRVPAPYVQRPTNPFKRITQAGKERVLCFDEATGKPLWTHEYDCDYSMSYSVGPRTTPAVDGDLLYTLGGEGDLLCLKTADGSVVWQKRLTSEETPTPVWGFACHPLIDGDRVIVQSGGHDPAHGHGVVTAFDKKTGEVRWSALSAKQPGYSAPMIYTSAGVRQLIIWDPESINSLDPETGKVYWTLPFGPANQGVTIMTPRLYHDAKLGDLLVVATQYEGMTVYKLSPTEPAATVLWHRAGKTDKKTDALHILISTPTLRDGHIFGIDAYGELRCLDLATGDRLWSTEAATNYDAGPQKWSTAFLIPLGDTGPHFLIANEHGDLILADLDATGYHETSRTHLLDPTNSDPGRPVLWCHPALANGCVFWRNDKEMVCAEMSMK
jgi:outer membrane protein assembly factor BamB